MLALVGIGLYDEKDLTLKGLEVAKNADKVYIELYTGKWFGNLENLSKMVGKQIIKLTRNDLEENSNKILKEAKSENIVIFVQGDPLIATTHISLLTDANRQKIRTSLVHNASIISAIAETGLHIYRFGSPITIPFLEKTKGKLPQSVYDTIKNNLEHNLHTLCLLDVIGEANRYLNVDEALDILLKLEEQNGKDVIKNDTKIIVFNAGNRSKIAYGNVKYFINKVSDTPAVIIVPSKLHFTEKEYLELYEV